ncbi:hypothetical protein HOU02_gp126 [Caulobacter phage CcrBL9]|uniref:Uncharacterized protein n=1 Tax=Caulobacter phage CcrBL9 TaxID=2283270 RepID=A0A385EBW5_9CAUD|nr:hypothetical protein HOU02_gp126 [Caulobacter phage CcrBL9]AXQ69150.1 hypothetical protein CcrBL9_gp126 [Caulobacter phage CcrBL9]
MDTPITFGTTDKQTLVEGTPNTFTPSKPYTAVTIHSDRNLYVRLDGEDAADTDFYWLKDAYLTVRVEWGVPVSVLVADDQDSGGVVRFTETAVV